MKIAMALLLLLTILFGAGLPAAAEDEQDPEAGKPEAGKPEVGEQPKPASPMQRLLTDLEALVAREKARPEYDKKMVEDLESLIKAFRKAEKDARPVVKLDDLSEEDRERLKDEVKKELAEERQGGEGGDWASRERSRRVERALEGITLKDDQRAKVEEMLGEFVGDAWTAYRNGDVGLVNDLKKDLEKRLKPVVGSKKARDIINNVNRQLIGRRGW